MTFRQKEFIRHYLSGKPAAVAAMAAGYAGTTAERNAATLLKHPLVQARIARARAQCTTITPQDIDLCRRRLVHILSTCADPALQVRASSQLLRLASLQRNLVLDDEDELEEDAFEAKRSHDLEWAIQLQPLEHQILAEAGIAVEDLNEIDDEMSIKINEILEQSAQYQQVREEHAKSYLPPETDALPTGHPAYDLTPATAHRLQSDFIPVPLQPAPATLGLPVSKPAMPVLFPRLQTYLEAAISYIDIESSPRKPELERLARWLSEKQAVDTPAHLTVICTHNSRRSHLGQFWLAAAAALYGAKLDAHSGGTEATACHPNTLAALERAGAVVTRISEDGNPHWQIAFSPDTGIEAWSKVYSDPANPQSGYAALMVCTDADEACPLVLGAEARFSLPYQDPKHADGTLEQEIIYDTASHTIAAEMAWLVRTARENIA